MAATMQEGVGACRAVGLAPLCGLHANFKFCDDSMPPTSSANHVTPAHPQHLTHNTSAAGHAHERDGRRYIVWQTSLAERVHSAARLTKLPPHNKVKY